MPANGNERINAALAELAALIPYLPNATEAWAAASWLRSIPRSFGTDGFQPAFFYPWHWQRFSQQPVPEAWPEAQFSPQYSFPSRTTR